MTRISLAAASLAVAVSWNGAAYGQAAQLAPLEVGGEEVSKLEDIEDAAIEELLGMELSDRLGNTTAVSRTAEEVLRAPATLTTIRYDRIRRSGATTIPDLLRWVPGVQVFRSAPGNYVVSLRGAGGLGGNNVVVTVDGVPINSPLDGSVDWDAIPVNLQDVESVEVVRGPVSTSYGANAYTGVINIVTRDALGISPAYAARVQGGVGNEGSGFLSGSGRLVHIGERLRLKWLFDSTYDALHRGSSSEHPAHERAGFIGLLGWQLTKNNRVSVEVGRAVSRRSSLDHLVLESELQRRELLFGQLKWEGTTSGVLESYQLWARTAMLLTRADAAAYSGFSYADTESNRAGAGADVRLKLHDVLGASFGAVGEIDHISAPYVHPNVSGAFRNGYGVYGGVDFRPTESFDVRLAARGDAPAVSTELEQSYRASVGYHESSFGVRLTAATAFRSPSYVEAAGRFVDPGSRLILLEGTPSIRPPRNSSLELGGIFSPLASLSISPTIFLSRFEDAIVEDFAPLVRRTFRNDPDPRTLVGGELAADWKISDGLSLRPSLSVIRFVEDNDEVVATIGVPEQNAELTAGLQIDGALLRDRLRYEAGALYVSDKRYDVRAGIPPRILAARIPDAGYLNGSVEYQLTRVQPVWLSLRLRAHLPSDLVESPLPGAAALGHSAIVGLEYGSE
jgi:iron complex outermembrane receptor protein